MLSANDLLLLTLNDLEEKVNNPSEYSMLRASALLRQLILDGPHSIAIQANRSFRIRLRFSVRGDIKPPKMPEVKWKKHLMFWRNPYPEGIDVHDFKLDDFLSYIIFMSGDWEFSIRNFISVGANILGGVHLTHRITDSDRHLIEVSKKSQIYNKTTSAYDSDHVVVSLKLISMVVLDALKPLKQKIESGGGIEPQS